MSSQQFDTTTVTERKQELEDEAEQLRERLEEIQQKLQAYEVVSEDMRREQT